LTMVHKPPPHTKYHIFMDIELLLSITLVVLI
jgi:hypothetical protein